MKNEVKMKKITVEIMESSYELLKSLDENNKVEKVIETLCEHAADGVRRSGAWERNWVIQCFGDDFESRM